MVVGLCRMVLDTLLKYQAVDLSSRSHLHQIMGPALVTNFRSHAHTALQHWLKHCLHCDKAYYTEIKVLVQKLTVHVPTM